jgi:2-polyprenyl-3-methyl-5-hydroxy-6-metoxy-1,4-benzoquinol methylase
MLDPDEIIVGNQIDKAAAGGIQRRLVNRFNEKLVTVIGTVPATRMLDVGCGDGAQTARLAERFPKRRFTGLDLDRPELREKWAALSVPGLRFVAGRVEQLPFTGREFDMVTAIELLEHLPEPELGLDEIRRVCSGWLVASVPWEPYWRIGNYACGRYRESWGNTPGHIQHWGHRSFRRLLARYGAVEHSERVPMWSLARVRLH